MTLLWLLSYDLYYSANISAVLGFDDTLKASLKELSLSVESTIALLYYSITALLYYSIILICTFP